MEDHKGDALGDMMDEKAMRRFNEIIERIEQVRGYLGLNRSKFCRAMSENPMVRRSAPVAGRSDAWGLPGAR